MLHRRSGGDVEDQSVVAVDLLHHGGARWRPGARRRRRRWRRRGAGPGRSARRCRWLAPVTTRPGPRRVVQSATSPASVVRGLRCGRPGPETYTPTWGSAGRPASAPHPRRPRRRRQAGRCRPCRSPLPRLRVKPSRALRDLLASPLTSPGGVRSRPPAGRCPGAQQRGEEVTSSTSWSDGVGCRWRRGPGPWSGRQWSGDRRAMPSSRGSRGGTRSDARAAHGHGAVDQRVAVGVPLRAARAGQAQQPGHLFADRGAT